MDKNNQETPWTDAPAAVFDEDTATVDWDLSSVGALENDVTYRVSFTVWPNQDAYDAVLELNRGHTYTVKEYIWVEGANASGDLIITIVNDADGLVKLIDGQMAIKVGNERGAALPATGGPGTKLIYLLGGILTLGAGLLLMRRRTI